MTRADDLMRLAERVEQLSGGDREVDCAIVKAIFGVNPYPTAFPDRDWQFYTDDMPSRNAPAYTASLDAAMTLVPPWSVRLGNLPSGRWFASLGTQKSMQEIEGATPALALTAACLRALSPGEGRSE